MRRIHIPNMGPDQENIPEAIAVGVRECKSCDCKQLTIITPVRNNLDSNVIGMFLGRDVSKKLMKGDSVRVSDHGVSLLHESVSTIQKGRTPQVGLAFYVSKSDIQKLDELDFKCLIFVPWLDEDGVDWAQKWDAETLGRTTENASVNLPPEVEESMRNLTACVNLSTGLSHPTDKEHAKRKFSELRSSGLRWNSDEIEKWAVRSGWKASDAEELAKLSAQYT